MDEADGSIAACGDFVKRRRKPTIDWGAARVGVPHIPLTDVTKVAFVHMVLCNGVRLYEGWILEGIVGPGGARGSAKIMFLGNILSVTTGYSRSNVAVLRSTQPPHFLKYMKLPTVVDGLANDLFYFGPHEVVPLVLWSARLGPPQRSGTPT